MEFVEVEWLDAWQDAENFQSAHGITLTHKPLVVKTLGWLMVRDEIGVSIANERTHEAETETFRGRTFIPHGMVQSVTPYRLVRPRTPKKAPL